MRILYIDRDRGHSSVVFKTWIDIMRTVIESKENGILDTLIIGGKDQEGLQATVRVPATSYYFSQLGRRLRYNTYNTMLYDSVMKGLSSLFKQRTYDAFIVGTYGLAFPLYALGLAEMTGLYTHDLGIFSNILEDAKSPVGRLDHHFISIFKHMGFHFLPQLESTKKKLVSETQYLSKKVHVMPIPPKKYEGEVNPKIEYDFSSVTSNFPWDNNELLQELINYGKKWLLVVYRNFEPEPKENVTVKRDIHPQVEYYRALASAKIGVQTQLKECYGMHVTEHAQFHPVMLLPNTNFYEDYKDFAIPIDQNFKEISQQFLDDEKLREEQVMKSRGIIAEKFSYGALDRGMESFLDNVKIKRLLRGSAFNLVSKLKQTSKNMSQIEFLKALNWDDEFFSQMTLQRIFDRIEKKSGTYFGYGEVIEDKMSKIFS